jgi:hypothetical protein
MTLGATPKEIEMNAAILHMVGFTDREIQSYGSALDPAGNPQPPINLGDEAWQKAVNERQQWLSDIQEAHVRATGNKYNRRQLDNIIDSFYDKDPEFSPWDWFKKEYQRMDKKTGLTDYVEAARQRALKHTYPMRRYAKN